MSPAPGRRGRWRPRLKPDRGEDVNEICWLEAGARQRAPAACSSTLHQRHAGPPHPPERPAPEVDLRPMGTRTGSRRRARAGWPRCKQSRQPTGASRFTSTSSPISSTVSRLTAAAVPSMYLAQPPGMDQNESFSQRWNSTRSPLRMIPTARTRKSSECGPILPPRTPAQGHTMVRHLPHFFLICTTPSALPRDVAVLDPEIHLMFVGVIPEHRLLLWLLWLRLPVVRASSRGENPGGPQ